MTIKELVNSGSAHQVMFYDGEGMCTGILIGDKIACGCCGAIFEVEDVVFMARDARELGENVTAIRLFPKWIDVSEEIQGDTSEYCDWEGTVLLEMEEN